MRSPTRSRATPASIHTPRSGPSRPSGTRSKETAASIAPAPSPASAPTTGRATITQPTSRPARRTDDRASAPMPEAISIAATAGTVGLSLPPGSGRVG